MVPEGNGMSFLRAVYICSETILIIQRNLFFSVGVQFGGEVIFLECIVYASYDSCYLDSCKSRPTHSSLSTCREQGTYGFNSGLIASPFSSLHADEQCTCLSCQTPLECWRFCVDFSINNKHMNYIQLN